MKVKFIIININKISSSFDEIFEKFKKIILMNLRLTNTAYNIGHMVSVYKIDCYKDENMIYFYDSLTVKEDKIQRKKLKKFIFFS